MQRSLLVHALFRAILFTLVAIPSGACGGAVTTVPPESSGGTAAAIDTAGESASSGSGAAVPATSGSTVTITFNGLTGTALAAPYAESGFVVTPTQSWVASTTFGDPAPFIEFSAPGGKTVTQELRVTAHGSTFAFASVDLYSSTTTIPYTIVGLRSSQTVFTLTSTVPHTYGSFQTVTGPVASESIDTLSIQLTNSTAPCCANPVGLDNIVLTQ